MSYIVQALRKLEQERRRVTVTEMTLFRGLSERWKSESLVWRYLLVVSVILNTGFALWLALIFFAGSVSGIRTVHLPTRGSSDPGKEIVAMPFKSSSNRGEPLTLRLDVRRGMSEAPSRAPEPLRNSLSQRYTRHDQQFREAVNLMPQQAASLDEIEMHDNGALATPNVVIWKDEKGNIHYSGTAGRN